VDSSSGGQYRRGESARLRRAGALGFAIASGVPCGVARLELAPAQ